MGRRWGIMGWTALIVLVGLPFCGAGAFGYFMHRLGTPPDVAEVAFSAEVNQESDRAAGLVDARLVAAVGTAPWLRLVTAGVEDVCYTEYGPLFASGYQPVRCFRTVTRVLAAEAGPAGRDRQWDQALRDQGWRATGEPADRSYTDESEVRLNVRVLGPVVDPERQLPEAGSENVVHRVAAPADVAKIRRAATRAGYLVTVTAILEYHHTER